MIVRRRSMRRLSLDKCLVQGRWSPMPDKEIKSERELMETNNDDPDIGSEKRALPIDNRGAYKC